VAKLISPKAELTAIYHVCNGKQEVSTRLIAKLSENHFGHSPAQAAWRRLMSLAKSRGRIPDYYALCEDTTLSNDDIRQLKDFEPNRKVKTLEDASDLVETLENHRLLRSQYKLAEDIYEHLDGDEVDPTSFLTQIELAMGEMRSSRSAEDLIVQFGLDSNIGPLIESVLDQDEKPDYIPTGFKTWDSVNGGVPLGSLFVIAGTTGGGKSVLASVQLLVNMSSYAPVCLVPLEMTAKEMAQRITANQTGIGITKIINKKLTPSEVKIAFQKMKALDKRISDQDSRYALFSPDRDMEIEEILYSLKPFGYKVILIDYISLLKGVDGDDAWQALGAVARTCKLWADHNKCIIILLAQLSDEGKVRYSRAVGEHASLQWTFVVTDSNRESGEIEIKQPKARNLNPFPFSLGVDYATMRVYDLDDAPENEVPKKVDPKSEKRGSTRVYTQDDDDDEVTKPSRKPILGNDND
jgi:replicative DNA helicase